MTCPSHLFERTGQLRALPAVRAGQYRLDVARGWLYHGDTRRALRALQAGRRAAPQLIRVHPMASETVRVLAPDQPFQVRNRPVSKCTKSEAR